MQPFNVQSNIISQLKLWRLPDGNFRILQDGEFTILICGPGYILIDERMVNIFKKLREENLSIRQVKITDQVTKEEKNNYFELLINNSISPDTINSVNVEGLQTWEYNRECLFVSPELKEFLQLENINELEFSEGFSYFG